MEISEIFLVRIVKKKVLTKRRIQAKEVKRAKLSKIQNVDPKQRENQIFQTKTLRKDNYKDPNL